MTSELFSEKQLVEKYFSISPSRLSAFSFVNIFLWKDFFEFEFDIIGGNLCVFAGNEAGIFLYLPPSGENLGREVIEECFNRMEKVNKGSGVSRIENVPQSFLELFADDFDVYDKGPEYCYLREEVADLKGNKYKSKRSSYNQFVKAYSCEYLPFNKNMLEECMRLYDTWAVSRKKKYLDDMYRYMIEDNSSVHRLAMENFEELGLVGRVVRIDNKIRAYTFGYKLSDDVFCVLMEVADLDIKGLPVFVFSEFCSDPEVEGFKFINVMDSFGMKNIEQVKLSFRPTREIASYVVSKKKR